MYNPGSQSNPTPPEDKPYVPGASTPTPQPEQPRQPQQYSPESGQPTQYVPQQAYAPPSGTPPYTPPPVEAPRKKSPLLLILAIVGGVIVLCVVGIIVFAGSIFGGVMALTQPVVDAGDSYMSALRDGDYGRAFELSAPSLQDEVGNAAGLEDALGFKQPASWTFTSRSIRNGEGRVSGDTKYKAGDSGTVEIILTQINNEWKVLGISLR